jgi:hypothetical protein
VAAITTLDSVRHLTGRLSFTIIVELFNNGIYMATVNFSVPDEVKEEFDKVFGDQNKSAVIARLMQRAVREHKLQLRRRKLFNELSRVARKVAADEGIRKARVADRS